MPVSLRENEELIKAVRRHSVFIISAVFGWPLLPAVLVSIRYLADFDFLGYWTWVLLTSLLIIFLVILYRIFMWKRNVLIITNIRIIENEQRGLFSRTVTELLYDDVRQISYDKNGLNSMLYNFGDIKIQTASDDEIVVEKIPDPDKIVGLINSIRKGNV